MKIIAIFSLVIALASCTKSSNPQSLNATQVPPSNEESISKLVSTDISIVANASNLSEITTSGQYVYKFNILSSSAGKVKVDISYLNGISINQQLSTCSSSTYLPINSSKSCVLALTVDASILSTGIYPLNIQVSDFLTKSVIKNSTQLINIAIPLVDQSQSQSITNNTSCKTNYHLEGRKCVLSGQIATCSGTAPSSNVTFNNGTTYLKTWVNNAWSAPISYFNGTTGDCSFQCNSGYNYNATLNSCEQALVLSQVELVSMPGDGFGRGTWFSVKNGSNKAYVLQGYGIGSQYLREAYYDSNLDSVNDGQLDNFTDLIGASRFTCGKNNVSNYIECLNYSATASFAAKRVMYDDLNNGTGTSLLPISKVKKMISAKDSNIASTPASGNPYYSALLDDNRVITWYNSGANSTFKGMYVKYSVANDSTIDGDLVLDSDAKMVSYISSNIITAPGTIIYTCGTSGTKVYCWSSNGSNSSLMAMPIEYNYSDSNTTVDGQLDATTIKSFIGQGFNQYPLAILNSGEVITWLIRGVSSSYAARKIKLYNTTTPLTGVEQITSVFSGSTSCAKTSNKIYCWQQWGQGTQGAQPVQIDTNADGTGDTDLDATNVTNIIGSSGAYFVALLSNGQVLTWNLTGRGTNFVQNVKIDTNNDGTGDTNLTNMSMPIVGSGSSYFCGIYNNENLMCWLQSGIGTSYARPAQYDSDDDLTGDTTWKINGPNPKTKKITITKTANQGTVNVKDLITSTVIGTCSLASTSCNIQVPYDSNITIESIPSIGYSFLNYTDANCLGTNSTCNLSNVITSKTITPTFSANNYSITVNLVPGTYSSDVTYAIKKNGVACTSTCLTTLNYGNTINVTATPNAYTNVSSLVATGSNITGITNATNQITFTLGDGNANIDINVVDKPLTVPTFSFNGTLSGSLITLVNNPLTIATSNIPMARQMLISESSDCSTGSYTTYATSTSYTHSVPVGTKNISFKYKNNSELSACYSYQLYVQNASRTCVSQPSNSTGGLETSSNGGTTWSACTGFTCDSGFHTEDNLTCTSNTRSCAITNGSGTQTWSGSAWGTCYVSSCSTNFHTEDNLTCVSNTRNCAITNGSGSQTWSGSAWGTCMAAGCSGGYTIYQNACILIQSRACSPQPSFSTGGVQYSYDNGSTWGTCSGFTCNTNYTNVGGSCVLTNQARTCTSQPANSTGGTESTTDGGVTWSACTGFTCDSPFVLSGSTCAVPALTNTTDVSMGFRSNCTISSGKAYCWGNNFVGSSYMSGVLGNISMSSSSSPYPVTTTGVLSGKTMTKISVGTEHACALDSTGKAYCWGRNDYGQLGTGSTSATASLPVAVLSTGVLSGKVLTDIKATNSSTCAMDNLGSVYCWGNSLGIGTTTTNSNAPVKVSSLSGITELFASYSNATYCARNSTTLYCWGENNYQVIQEDTNGNISAPMVYSPITFSGYKSVAFAEGHACFVPSSAQYQIKCRGSNQVYAKGTSDITYLLGQLYLTMTTVEYRSNYSYLSGVTNITSITAGTDHTCVIGDGSLICWGGINQPNYSYTGTRYANLPNGDGTKFAVRVDNTTVNISNNLLAGKTWNKIYSANFEVCALDSLGDLYCWGSMGGFSPYKRQ